MVYVGGKMSRMLTRKGKLQIHATLVPATVPDSFNISDTNNHDGLEHYLNYYDIFDMFQNEIFLPDDPDSDEYINILKSGIHTVASHPNSFLTMMLQGGVFTFTERHRVDSQCFGPPNFLAQDKRCQGSI
jgi:hypothetical protein